MTPAIFFSLLIIAVAFLPVFTLTGQAGRLFQPLAYTKTFVMLISALLSITFAPGAARPADPRQDPPRAQAPGLALHHRACTSRSCTWRCASPKSTVAIGLLAVLSAIPLAGTAGPRVHAAAERGRHPLHADHLPQHLDRGGQAAAADPGPPAARASPRWRRCSARSGAPRSPPIPRRCSMVETTVRLQAARTQWRKRHQPRWYSGWAPGWLKPVLRPLWPEQQRDDLGRADRRDERRRCSCPAGPTPGPCRSRPASTC